MTLTTIMVSKRQEKAFLIQYIVFKKMRHLISFKYVFIPVFLFKAELLMLKELSIYLVPTFNIFV